METANVFERFDQEIDLQHLKEDLQSVAAGEGQFVEVPLGNYEVRVDKLELVESKTGKPMLTSWLRIVSGQHKNNIIFYNQVINTAFGLHNANLFLRSLESGLEVQFASYSQYYNLALNIHEVIDDKYEYGVEYGQTHRGYKTIKITEVFEAE